MTRLRTNPDGLPRGSGSLQLLRRAWWMSYPDVTGKVVQENSLTGDYEEARKVLARRALIVARARVALLEEVADEAGRRTARGNLRSGTGTGITSGRGRTSGILARNSSAAEKRGGK